MGNLAHAWKVSDLFVYIYDFVRNAHEYTISLECEHCKITIFTIWRAIKAVFGRVVMSACRPDKCGKKIEQTMISLTFTTLLTPSHLLYLDPLN